MLRIKFSNGVAMIFILLAIVNRNLAATAPVITAISQNNGLPLTTNLIINGTNFNDTASRNVVYFGATKANVIAAASTQLTVIVPTSSLYSYISVTNLTTRLTGTYSNPFIPIYDTSCFIPATYHFKTRADFPLAAEATPNPVPYASAIGDLDGDGLADLVVCTESAVFATGYGNVSILHTYRNISTDGVLRYDTPIVDTISVGGKNVKLADIDGDGKLDVVVSCSGSGRLSLLRNYSTQGNIALTQPCNYASVHTGPGTFQGPYESAIADYDGDGRLDIAVVSQNISGIAENEIEIFRNIRTTPIIGNRAFPSSNMFATSTVDFPVGFVPFSLFAADFDGDGKPDIASSNFFDNTITVMRNNSITDTFIFDPPVNFPCGDGPLEVQVADFNNDGKPDICVVSFNDHGLTVFKNTATLGAINASSFAPGVTFTIPGASGSSGIGIGDFNGDKKLDIAVTNNTSDNLSIFRNTTSGTAIDAGSFVNDFIYTTGGSPVGVVVGDVDGDTKPDIVVTSNADNSVSVFEHVQLPDTASISGIDSVCMGSSITLTNVHCNKSLGYWSATNSHATVSFTPGSSTDSVAVISGLTAGTDTIVYAVVYLSDTNYVKHIIRVLASADTGIISGPTAICEQALITLSESSIVGVWSSSNTSVASIDAATGVLSAVAAGSAMILYTANSVSCGSLSAHHNMTVNSVPHSGNITGSGGACIGTPITLTVVGAGVGGSWVNLYPAVASVAVSGLTNVVIGAVVGADTILYIVPSAFCGSDTATKVLGFINSLNNSFPITGTSAICNGDSLTANNVAGGGTWSTSTPAVVTINATTGLINSLSAGTATISYAVTYSCGTADTFASFTVKPIPDVATVPTQTLCNNAASSVISFTGGVGTATYSWINGNSSIGLATSGTGNIASFIAVNPSVIPVSSIVSVTPVANGCIGSTGSFSVIVNPTPQLTSTITAPAICSGTLFTYSSASSTPGATFAWSRPLVVGLSNAAASGIGNPSEILNTTSSDSVIVTYVDTIKANGCLNTQAVSVKVNPLPHLSSTHTPPAICDSTMFSYVHISLTPGTAFAWSRDTVAGISNSDSTGVGNINEILINPTTDPAIVTYLDTLTANGCLSIDTVKVVVNPTPTLSSILSVPAICDSVLFNYTPSSATLYTTFSWSRLTTVGIANAADTGSGDPAEYLDNNTNVPVAVTYKYTLLSNSCSDTQNVVVTVNPQPVLSSTLTPNAICSSDTFNYTPSSAVAGSVYNWSRAGITGLANVAASGVGNPMEVLTDTIFIPVNVIYSYVVTANGCNDTQQVVVQLKPKPVLAGVVRDTVCSGSPFNYTASSGVSGTAFSWVRPVTAGIANPAGSGAVTINDTLGNLTYTRVNAIYVYSLTANGCGNSQSITLSVDPQPSAAVITTKSPAALCSNTLYQNFGTSSVLNDSVEYNWSAVNAAVWATGNSHRYSLVNFTTSGNAVVILSSGVAGYDCISKDTFAVAESNGISDVPAVMYFHYQFVCSPGNEDTYQWGYDDAELDSTILKGEIYQDYINTAPDPNKYYWVMTSKNGCTQKTYYKTPTGINEINSAGASIKVYPNPASNLLTIEFNNLTGGKQQVEILNVMGQKVRSANVSGNKTVVDVSELPPGSYLVSGYIDGMRIATTQFIKN